MPAPDCPVVCLTVKPVGEPDAGDRHVRFDERGWETARCRMAQATAPILDSTECEAFPCPLWRRSWSISECNADIAESTQLTHLRRERLQTFATQKHCSFFR
jgi:hypothetical protein